MPALTDEERGLVVGWLREYPPDVKWDAWGFGPMEYGKSKHTLSVSPVDFSVDTRAEYG